MKYNATLDGTARVKSGVTQRKTVEGRMSILCDIGVPTKGLVYSVLLDEVAHPY